MNVFVLESPSPNDLLREVNEADSLTRIGKMFGHRVVPFFLKNKQELTAAIDYLAELDLEDPADFFCFHFSCHGNDGGIALGPDLIQWADMFEILKPIFRNNTLEGKSILIISACGANKQKLSTKINLSLFLERAGSCLPFSHAPYPKHACHVFFSAGAWRTPNTGALP